MRESEIILKEFEILDEYPLNKEGMINFIAFVLLFSCFLSMFFYVEMFFLEILFAAFTFFSLLMGVVMYQFTFSLDEKFLTNSDAKFFLKYNQNFPVELKRDFLSHLDLDRVTLKDIKILNKEIKNYYQSDLLLEPKNNSIED